MYFLYVVFYFNKKLKAKKKNIQSPNDLLGIQEVDNKLMINITVQKCYGKSEAGKKKKRMYYRHMHNGKVVWGK